MELRNEEGCAVSRGAKASILGILSFIFLVLIPLLFIYTVSSYISKSGGDPSKYFHSTETYVLILGIAFTALYSAAAYHEKGSEKKLALSLIASLFLVLWGYFFLSSMSIYYEGKTYAYEVLVPGISLLLAASLSFKILYYVVEYLVYRNEVYADYSGENQNSMGRMGGDEDEEYGYEEYGDNDRYF